MNLNERFDVSPGKIQSLLARLRELKIDPAVIEEEFLKGSGKGGQKINKTANCVRLSYPLLGLAVRVQTDRRRTVNRFLALRELLDRIELAISPGSSRRLREIERLRRRKARRQDRSARKYAPAPDAPVPGSSRASP